MFFIDWIRKTRRIIRTKSYLLSVFEIALFGLLLSLYMITSVIERFVFVGAFNISLTYAVFVVFGLALGPWKGAIIGLLCDTLNQIIFGISTWMPEYAIIPILIAFLSGYIMNIFTKNQKATWLIGFILLLLITSIFIAILVTQYDSLPINEVSRARKKKFSLQAVIGISVFGVGIIWISAFVFLLIYLFTRNIRIKYACYLLFTILLTIFIILIVSRWLWGPFAYINFHNRFRGGKWEYSEYYFFFMIPIVFKSLIEIPVYTFLIFLIFPVVKIIRQKINTSSKRIGIY
ncbi:ECF transporter S component [Metamycoplasma gateae]|uniref:ECF transporter S component n=1 Tax=Metamycoplasma gateae TaxID=35769 RepID=A0ABZ2AMJ5_9BACT|nr:ECF transporter S component [Metamycoplasma gateae]